MDKAQPAEEIQNFIDEAKQELSRLSRELYKLDDREYERAKGYWIAHIKTALDKDHDYLGGSMHTAQDTVNSLTKDSGAGGEIVIEKKGDKWAVYIKGPKDYIELLETFVDQQDAEDFADNIAEERLEK
jgi:hypothetical protein